MAEKEPTARMLIAQWVRDELDGQQEVQIPDLADSAAAHFGKDQEFLGQFFRENVRTLIYEIAVNVVAQSRSMIVLGDAVIDRDKAKQKARERRSPFSVWMEHVEDRHMRLLDMTREELLIAAKERRDRGNQELSIAKLWTTMARKLEGGQQVREAFTVEEIETLHATLNKKKEAA